MTARLSDQSERSLGFGGSSPNRMKSRRRRVFVVCSDATRWDRETAEMLLSRMADEILRGIEAGRARKLDVNEP